MNPNGQNQLWSKWIFDIRELSKRMPRADVELNAARWLRQGFGSAGAMRLLHKRHGWRIEAVVEGKPAHDPGYVMSVQLQFREFVEKGWGRLGALGSVRVKVIAGSKQDGKPSEQWIEMPSVIEERRM